MFAYFTKPSIRTMFKYDNIKGLKLNIISFEYFLLTFNFNSNAITRQDIREIWLRGSPKQYIFERITEARQHPISCGVATTRTCLEANISVIKKFLENLLG